MRVMPSSETSKGSASFASTRVTGCSPLLCSLKGSNFMMVSFQRSVSNGVGGKARSLGGGLVRLDAHATEGRDKGFAVFTQLAISLKHRFNDFGHFSPCKRWAHHLAGHRSAAQRGTIGAT